MANYYDVSRNYDKIRIKFSSIPKVSFLTNDHFTLVTDVTPIENPFREIQPNNDYDSIGRILTLRLAAPLESNTSYRLTVDGLADTADRTIPSEFFDFTTGVVIATSILPPVQETVAIRDYSIRSHAFLTGDTILNPHPDFYIVSTDPENQEVLLPEDYSNGRITIVFSQQPKLSYMNSQYFKAQRKLVQRAPSRWETLDAHVALAADNPWVYVDFPSNDESPVYNVEGRTYFVDGYKYRVKVSRNVSI